MTTPSIEQLLHHLIAFPTVSSAPTREIADFICTLAESHDVECVRHAYDDGRKINLLLRAGPAQDSHGLLLCGHLDVVPAAEPEWRSDPFQLIEQDGRLHGRGSADMKGFVALALAGLLAAAKKPLRAPLWLLLTSDEEVGAMGVQQFVNSDLVRRLPRNAIIGEPTQLAAVRMHKGHLKLRITVRGVAAHSGRPLEGVNAIELAGALIRRLAALAAEWREVRNEQSRYFEGCPFPVLNLGMIRGGSAVNIVPDECVLDMGIRLLPGQDSAAALRDVQFAISELPLLVREKLNTTVVNENPPLLCPEDALIHRELCRLLAQTDSRGVSFASDAGFLARQGIHCVLWGPGHMADAHRANESIERSQLEQAARLLDRVIERFCIECEGNR